MSPVGRNGTFGKVIMMDDAARVMALLAGGNADRLTDADLRRIEAAFGPAGDALRRIHALMDGNTWDADTHDDVAAIFAEIGAPCGDLDEPNGWPS